MARYIFIRICAFVPVLWAIITITFFLVRLAPGGPFDSEKAMSEETRKNIEAHYNFDAPLLEQYFDYLAGVVRGDLGPSFTDPGMTVNEALLNRIPVSLELGCYALLVALGIGLTTGVIASLRPNSALDHGPMAFAMTGICIPNFVLGPMLVLVFSLWLDWLPVAGWRGPAHKILPALTLGIAYAAYIARLTRGGMLEVLSQDFIRTARAKGLSEAAVVLKHGLRGGIQPVIAFLGPAVAGLMTGSFVVEKIFFVPGLGKKFVESALDRDYTMIIGTVLVYAAFVMVLNLAADIVHAWLDPRVREAAR